MKGETAMKRQRIVTFIDEPLRYPKKYEKIALLFHPQLVTPNLQLLIALTLTILLCFAAGSSASNLGASSEKPDVFCQVKKEPDPALMGSWKCMFERRLEEGGWETNPVEYRLIKYEDKYALYFYRVSRGGKKKYIGWRDWTINGTEILSNTGVRIFVENGEVFFVWEEGKPVKMKRTGP
jgi:hypothetical protein